MKKTMEEKIEGIDIVSAMLKEANKNLGNDTMRKQGLLYRIVLEMAEMLKNSDVAEAIKEAQKKESNFYAENMRGSK